jgi:hypothetical protein
MGLGCVHILECWAYSPSFLKNDRHHNKQVRTGESLEDPDLGYVIHVKILKRKPECANYPNIVSRFWKGYILMKDRKKSTFSGRRLKKDCSCISGKCYTRQDRKVILEAIFKIWICISKPHYFKIRQFNFWEHGPFLYCTMQWPFVSTFFLCCTKQGQIFKTKQEKIIAIWVAI